MEIFSNGKDLQYQRRISVQRRASERVEIYLHALFDALMAP